MIDGGGFMTSIIDKMDLRIAVLWKHYHLDSIDGLRLFVTALGFNDWIELCRAHDAEDASGPISKKIRLLLGEHGDTILKMLLIRAGND